MSEAASDPGSIWMAELLVPAAVSLIVGALAGLGAARLQREKLMHEFELQQSRLRTELKLEFATETAIRELLSDPRFPERKREFDTIHARLGAFDKKELRMHLVRAGAVSFKRKSDGVELWGLRELVSAQEITGEDEGAG